MHWRSMAVVLAATLSFVGLTSSPARADDELFGMHLQPHLEWVHGLVFDGMNRLGASWVRTTVYRGRLEPKPGRYQWKTLDALTQNAAKRNLGLLITIRTSRGRDDASRLPQDLNSYAALVRALSERYRGRKIAWQIEDKVDLPTSWDGTPVEYTRLLQTAYKAAHEADPHVVILAAGLAGPFPHLDNLDRRLEENRAWFNAILETKTFDGLDLHNYFPPSKNRWGITFEEYLDLHKQWMAAKNIVAPIWISEAGISSKPISVGKEKIFFSEETQADALRAIYAIARKRGVARVFWCKVIDTPEGWSSAMGVSHANQKAKPAADVYKNLSKGREKFVGVKLY